MNRILIVSLFLLLTFTTKSQIKFDDYFTNNAIRIDYYHCGNINNELFYLDELIKEDFWGGPTNNTVDKFGYGNILFEAYSLDSILIFSKTYSSLFAEYKNQNSINNIPKCFSESIQMPFPKHEIIGIISIRDDFGNFKKAFSIKINPNNNDIIIRNNYKFNTLKVINNGSSSDKIDIAFIAEGYTANEIDKFRTDSKNLYDSLFSTSPFKDFYNKFNVWLIESESEESGTDIPTQNIWKKTIANSTFNTFNSERYLTSLDNKKIRDIASNVPYDQIVLLINTDKYGGGGIFNFYSTTVSDHISSQDVFIHEFGHAFGGLGDEYFNKGAGEESFYKKNIEPWEPNLTTLTNFNSKWQNFVNNKTTIPTPELNNDTIIGVFEGGGYSPKGIYRPFVNCKMRSLKYNFCPICTKSIIDIINFYSNE